MSKLLSRNLKTSKITNLRNVYGIQCDIYLSVLKLTYSFKLFLYFSDLKDVTITESRVSILY